MEYKVKLVQFEDGDSVFAGKETMFQWNIG